MTVTFWQRIDVPDHSQPVGAPSLTSAFPALARVSYTPSLASLGHVSTAAAVATLLNELLSRLVSAWDFDFALPFLVTPALCPCLHLSSVLSHSLRPVLSRRPFLSISFPFTPVFLWVSRVLPDFSTCPCLKWENAPRLQQCTDRQHFLSCSLSTVQMWENLRGWNVSMPRKECFRWKPVLSSRPCESVGLT